ncbi:hypothetical protein DV515_00015696 [Chloebia gouldiae]|uniref:unspecific monooxygenase n=1 Tax=Chloebia gouldiae TaxID=44316 RepID=A0A3L8RUT1_CHLGU|nr:hypothetical protein DV515_00015696 [Chloebia gouldiae]
MKSISCVCLGKHSPSLEQRFQRAELMECDMDTVLPERFLSAAGTELSRPESEKVLSFGLGRRRCIGETIGRWEIFLFLTTLLQQLHFSLRPGEHVDTTPQYGLTMKYKKCEAFQIQQRFPVRSSL